MSNLIDTDSGLVCTFYHVPVPHPTMSHGWPTCPVAWIISQLLRV